MAYNNEKKLNQTKLERLKKERVKAQLVYWGLLSGGPNSLDIKNKNQVKTAQSLLGASGHYKGEIDGKYGPLTDQARWTWVKDIMKDPHFNWALIKQSAKEIFS
jgi:peptidoglycan hydrolase-like protein with peptidoglycan-binding domain